VDNLTFRATLTGLTIKPGKKTGDDPVVTMTLAPDFDDQIKDLLSRVGQPIDLTVRFVQTSLPMSMPLESAGNRVLSASSRLERTR
jgi:hypothetical protein